MDKMKMQTSDLADENFKKLKELFPNAVTETKDENGNVVRSIDADVLRQEINTSVVEGPEERYQFTWPGKRESIRLAAAPIAASLRPCREESVNFDTTENVYIEGDNLDVLKLLRETYLGRVKMIYIDPPYNTGNDFIYEDDFSGDEDDFLLRDNQYDDLGNRLVQNTDSNGRFHTDWLNMLYPRLKVAKDLLSEDGVIFISIDNNEVKNTIALCNEVFAENNCLGVIANVSNPKGRSDDKYVATAHEYILAYARNLEKVLWYGFEPTEEIIIKRYNKTDTDGKKYREMDLRKTGENDLREDRPNLFYYFHYNQITGDFYPSKDSKGKDNYIVIRPLREDGKEGNWRWGMETAKSKIDQLVPKFMPTRKVWGVMQKDYLEGRSLVKPTSAWTFKDVNSERGTEDFTNLNFDKRIFPKPKPVGTLKRCITLASKKDDDFVLYFFSGSATAAHAVMQLNAEDGKKRKFIMVQLPEPCVEDSKAYKAGFKNICEIGKERIRRAGKIIKDDLTTKNLDTGFRVFKLDSSNMKDFYYSPSETPQKDLLGRVDNIKEGRTPEDLLFQVMLEFGIPLSSKIKESVIAGKKVFNVEDNYLIACFDDAITEEAITAIAKEKPQYVVLRDSGFKTDSVAANFEQIFATYSPDTTRRVL